VTRPAWVPAGFAVEQVPGRVLVARPQHLPALLRAGLLEPSTWDRACPSSEAQGRGPTGTLALEGLVLRLKRMRRGGLARHAWRNRFLGTRRLVENLTVPLAALGRGVATVEPIALLVEQGGLGLSRAWLAALDVPDAASLAARLLSSSPPTGGELRAVVAAVRHMHDCGVDHRDLNLGNILLPERGSRSGPLVIDLDRAGLYDEPLAIGVRARALRRLERSTVKLLGPTPRAGPVDLRRLWYEEYAAGDAALGRRLARARRFNRWAIALHGLGWRGQGSGGARG